MKRFAKLLAMMLSAAMILTSLTGCGSSVPAELSDYANTVAATYGDEQIMLDEANFFLRYQQMGMESYYWSFYTSYYGFPSLWEAPYDEYKTLAVYVKQLTMQQIRQTRVLCDHASEYGLSADSVDKDAVADAAQKLIDELDPAFFIFSDVTVEKLAGWLEKNDLAYRVYEAVKDAAEVTVTAEETEMYTIKYVSFSDSDTTESEDEGGETEQTELPSAEKRAEAFYNEVVAGGSIDTLAEEQDKTASSASYLKADTESTSALFTYTKEYKTGDVIRFQDNGTWYVAYVVSDSDAEATATKTESVTDEKKNEVFNEIYKGWQDASPKFKVTSAWDDLEVSSGEKMIPETEPAEENEAEGDAPADDAESADPTDAITTPEDVLDTDDSEAATEPATAG
ncbi:MAG: hypothetical protein IJS22_09325 [Lachnospiraceae bacterium]|nr:hypothetical protein [Lachnospiraceae bacterium]